MLANLRFNVEVNRRWLLQVGPARNADAARLTVRSLDWTDYASPAPSKATRAPPTPTQTPLTATRAPSATARVPRAAAQVEPPEHRAPEGETIAAAAAETTAEARVAYHLFEEVVGGHCVRDD